MHRPDQFKSSACCQCMSRIPVFTMATRRSARLSVHVAIEASTEKSTRISSHKRRRTDSQTAPAAESSAVFGGDSPLSDGSERALPNISAANTKKAKPNKSKTKKAFSPQPEDYPKRVSNDWKIGAHVSAAGGVEMSIPNAAAVGYHVLLGSQAELMFHL